VNNFFLEHTVLLVGKFNREKNNLLKALSMQCNWKSVEVPVPHILLLFDAFSDNNVTT